MFDPANWYWKKKNGQLYSSATRSFVTGANRAFKGWLACGYLPTPYPVDASGEENDQELARILSNYGLAFKDPDLDEWKAELKIRIDAEAETERLKYITPGVGQAMTYQQKVDEAKRYLATEKPVAADFPLLNAEVGLTANTLGEVASVVIAAFSQWIVIGSQIEIVRLRAKAEIDAAASVEAAQQAAADAAWPTL